MISAIAFRLALAPIATLQTPLPVVFEGRSSEDVELSDIRDVTTSTSRGEIFVLEGREGKVIALDRRGRLVRTLGRKGLGPGEIAEAYRLGWVADTLWVIDVPARLHFFLPDGKLLRTVATSPNPFAFSDCRSPAIQLSLARFGTSHAPLTIESFRT
jgi:hypothetical protein